MTEEKACEHLLDLQRYCMMRAAEDETSEVWNTDSEALDVAIRKLAPSPQFVLPNTGERHSLEERITRHRKTIEESKELLKSETEEFYIRGLKALIEEREEELEFLQELQLLRFRYNTAAERIAKKMKESNDYVVINNKRYVSYAKLCEILEGKDILKEGE